VAILFAVRICSNSVHCLPNEQQVTQQLSVFLVPLSALNLLYSQLAYLESECGTLI